MKTFPKACTETLQGPNGEVPCKGDVVAYLDVEGSAVLTKCQRCGSTEYGLVPPLKPDDLQDKFIVRVYDGFDHQWTDVSEPVTKEEADRIWNEHTNNGTRNTRYRDIDYYKIFPADTKMVYSGGFGEID